MTDKGMVTLSVGSISALTIFVLTQFDIGGEHQKIVLTGVPFLVSVLALILEWCRFKFGWSSLQELKDRKAHLEHQQKYDKKIAICEEALKKDLIDEQKAEYRQRLHEHMQMKLMDVSVKEASSKD